MELTLRHNPMLDDADCEAILAIHAAVGWDRRMPPAELRTLYGSVAKIGGSQR